MKSRYRLRGAYTNTLPMIINELALFIGPEGGFTDDEVSCFERYGIRGIFLGDRILRAETAVLYGLAAVNTIFTREKAMETGISRIRILGVPIDVIPEENLPVGN